jgi:hypothetical protein
MKDGRKRCADCGQLRDPLHPGDRAPGGSCATCGAPVDSGALSDFADRLARFGLGATREPLLSRVPELPDAK